VLESESRCEHRLDSHDRPQNSPQCRATR
jgi:hypothetical protein